MLSVTVPSRAQQPNLADYRNVAGMSFIVAFPDSTANQHDKTLVQRRFDDQALLCIYSAVPTTITVKGPSGYQRTLTNPGNRFSVLDLMAPETRAPRPIVTESGRVVNNTFRIDATTPVIVYCYIVTEFGSEAWTPVPVENWGTEYYAAILPGDYVYDIGLGGYIKAAPARGELLVV